MAKALPRLHGRAAPGPDLDASILAAAQAAVRPSKPLLFKAKPRIRWIAPAALAASMVLAVGMAWQLRPLPTLESAHSTAQSDTAGMPTAVMMEPAPGDQPVLKTQSIPATTPAVAPVRAQSNAPAVSTPEAPPVPGEMPVNSQGAPHAAPVPPAPPAPAAPLPAVETDAAAPPPTLDQLTSERVMRARTAEPAASASARSMTRDAASTSANKADAAETTGPVLPKTIRATPVAPEVRNEAEMAVDAGFVGDPTDDIPPATAASPAVRDAWLRRIGELLEQGERQEAEASLAEFRRRYPAAVLPPRLRALENEP